MAVRAPFKAACIQMCSGLEPERNVASAFDLIDEAIEHGADFVATPEMTNVIDPEPDRLFSKVARQDADPSVAAFTDHARKRRRYILAGSFALRDGRDRLVNRSILFDPAGRAIAGYDKMHMFDVRLADGESYRESATYAPGDKAVWADTVLCRVGLTVCYDMRFPALYRVLAQAGVQLITIPSAFTRPTGKAHWETLLRARAIETGCYVLAAAQAGVHESGRETYGHSMIVAPWGEVLADAGEGQGYVVADIDPSTVEAARRRIPALGHDRRFAAPSGGVL